MLISLFNTTDRSGGAGIAAFRLGAALATRGVHAPVFCLHRKFADASTFRFRPRNSEVSRSLQTQRDGLKRIQQRYVTDNRSSRSKTIFSEPWASGLLVGDEPLIASSRVLHLHWVNHFLDLHSLRELAALRRPIVWTLHDEWIYTAGCHYTSGCDQWRTHCDTCPQLLQDPQGLVPQWFDDKAELLASLDLTIVTPSAWLGERARRAPLLAGKRVEVIRNAFDVEVFQPSAAAARAQARERFGFDDRTIVLGFGAASLADTRKGYRLLVEALGRLVDDGSLRGLRVGLLVFGSRSDELDRLREQLSIAYIGELHDEHAIAGVLGAIDGFVVPSLEENYPNVIIESLLCGTPVVGYGCGGIAEQIDDGVNGLLVEPVGDVAALADALRRFCQDAALRERLAGFRRDDIARRHDFRTIADQTLALYRSIAPDFDEPLPDDIVAYHEFRRAQQGPKRDVLGVPTFRAAGDSLVAGVLLSEAMDAVRADLRAEARAKRERGYGGFFGRPLSFGVSGDAAHHLNAGWSPPESQGCWSAESQAGVAVEIVPGTRRVAWTFDAFCKGNSQIAVLSAGGVELGRLRLKPVRDRHRLEFDLPEFARVGGIVQFALRFPHAQPEAGTARKLGMFLCALDAEVIGSAG